MASTQNQAPNADLFDSYFRRADLDRDGRISGAEAVAFFQGSGLPKQVLARVWNYADQRQSGYLGRPEFYNALKLVTVAQSKRELTPEIVKAALYGPASAKIPAPQINFATSPATPSNSGASASASHTGAVAPSAVQNIGPRGPQVPPGANVNQQHFTHQGSQLARPPTPVSVTASHSPHGVGSQGFPMGGSIAAVPPPSSRITNDWVGGRTSGESAGAASQAPSGGFSPSPNQAGFGTPAPGSTTLLPPRPPPASKMMPNMPQAKDSKGLGVSGNGVATNSAFRGDAFSAIASHPKQDSSVGNLPVSSPTVLVSAGNGYSMRPNALDSSTQAAQQAVRPLTHQAKIIAKSNQQVSSPSTSGSTSPGVSFEAGNLASGQPQQPWPKLTQSAIQKYTKVFVAVDKDKDGKITGEQARNLFLSWRLPREVLKQVWDLSDQDNDSMLSLREFCIALYLMERYREGRPIPRVLPSGVFDVTGAGPAMTGFNTVSWGPRPGFQQQVVPAGSGGQHTATMASLRPPVPVSLPKAEEGSEINQQKSRVPVLEKRLVDQLSKEEQDSLNLKFKEATDSEQKVEELEKEIRESREKIEFCNAKMQELVLYKSRCDNRLNEITERVSSDKREAELLAKKYEEKYKQAGDVASRLTIEEATFRDIQEKKMELYKAIVKMQQDSSPDGNIQAHVERIQADLDELIKNLNERCKQYGLRGRPTSLLELPFGWQPGIQEGAADWDEDWDKFADEDYTFVKELTLEVQNVIAPPKLKPAPASKSASTVESATSEATAEVTVETKSDAASSKAEEAVKSEKPSVEHEKVVENGSAYEQSEDGSATKPDSPVSKNIMGSQPKDFVGSEPGKRTNAEMSTHDKETQSDQASVSIFDKSFDEPSWGTFDTNDDTDSLWGFNPDSSTKGHDNVNFGENDLFGSGDWGLNPIRTQSSKADNLFEKKSAFTFDESVPSTPLYSSTNSPQKFRDSLQPSFDTFSRFDSFGTHDSTFFPRRETLSRFDSMRSSSDFDYGPGAPSFDDSDPFGTGLFRTSLESETPRRYSDSDPFSTGPYKTSVDSQTPKGFSDSDPFNSGPFSKSLESQTSRRASDVDPFGTRPHKMSSLDSQTPRSTFDSDLFSTRPHKTLSLDSQTPRSTFDSDHFGTGPFRRSMDNQTPKSSGTWSDF